MRKILVYLRMFWEGLDEASKWLLVAFLLPIISFLTIDTTRDRLAFITLMIALFAASVIVLNRIGLFAFLRAMKQAPPTKDVWKSFAGTLSVQAVAFGGIFLLLPMRMPDKYARLVFPVMGVIAAILLIRRMRSRQQSTHAGKKIKTNALSVISSARLKKAANRAPGVTADSKPSPAQGSNPPHQTTPLKRPIGVRKINDEDLIEMEQPSNVATLEDPAIAEAVDEVSRNVLRYAEYFPEREELLRQILYALLQREHVMVSGPKGTAKTTLCLALAKAISDARVWTQQAGRSYTDDEFFGPIDRTQFFETGKIVRRTERTLLDADIVFIDEFLDADRRLLRETHGPLFHRMWHRGTQQLDHLPLHTALVATNQDARAVVMAYPELDPTLDRFLLRFRAGKVQERAHKVTIDRHMRRGLYQKILINPPHPISFRHVQMLSDFLAHPDAVTISDALLARYHELCEMLSEKGRLDISDRREASVLRVVEAEALLNKRTTVIPRDLYAAKFGLIVVGEEKEEAAFREAILATLGERP